MPGLYALAHFPTKPNPFQPPGFILACQPALADRLPSGPGWLHESKFDGYRIIARKGGDQVRLWARTISDYSKAFMRDP
jgi:bifunctional non-homologous end joining protein LigD